MVEVFLQVALYAALAGFVAFCSLYAFLARPWTSRMGRHVLSFMSGLMLAFSWAVIPLVFGTGLNYEVRLIGWTVVLALIAGLVWWRVVILIKFQIQARRNPYHPE
jgi:hypothetical protein